jgi:peptidoglycan/LPS O-acetylase OafA/YrhL
MVPTALPSPDRITTLDAVRGMAIIGVILTHSLTAVVAMTGSYEMPTNIFNVVANGQFGVPLFFALSGWLMFSLYTGEKRFTQALFWSRRWARIWPLWVIFTVVSYVLYGAPDTALPLAFAVLLVLLFFGWLSPVLIVYPLGGVTIQQEMGHYLLFSLLRRRGPALLACTVIVGYASWLLAEYALVRVQPGSWPALALEAWLRLALFRSWPFFLLGGAAFVVYRAWRANGVREVLPRDPWVALTVSTALLLTFFTSYAQGTPGYAVLGYVVLAAALAVAANGIPIIGPVLRSLGRYSYFIYFMHFIVLRWLEGVYRSADLPGGNTTTGVYNMALLAAVVVVTTAISWCIGLVSWRVLEKPILDFAHRRVR